MVRADLLEIEAKVKLNFDAVSEIRTASWDTKMGMHVAALDLLLRVCRQDERYAQLQIRWAEIQQASARSTRVNDSPKRESPDNNRPQ
jgi:hypothetical protein